MVARRKGAFAHPTLRFRQLNFPPRCSKKRLKAENPTSPKNPAGSDKMKLVRYGAKGAEKPGLIDKSGQLRDLSAHVRDLDGEAYSAGLARQARRAGYLQASRRRRQAALRRAGHRHLEIRRDRPELQRPRQGDRIADPDRADLLHQGQHLAVGPERRGRKAARLHQARLGSRDRHHHRHPRQICLGSRRAEPRRRLLRLQRRLRAQFSAGARRPVDQGQVARHLRAGRPVAGDQGRNP